ncbi:MAG: YbaK/EbsC family protein [Candidatus Woesearchaeota archaeon]
MSLIDELKKFLDDRKIQYKSAVHEPVYTSEQAAKVRNEPLESGAKAMVFRSEGNFLMVVIAGDKKIDFKKVKSVINSSSLSLASPEEVLKVMGCEIGSVPPFGNLVNIPVYMDKSLERSPIINFNAGRHDTSFSMSLADYKKSVRPVVVDVAQA